MSWRLALPHQLAGFLVITRCGLGVGHRRRTVQRNSLGSSTRREHRRDVLHRQRGSLRHLFPNAETFHADLRRPKSSRVGHNVWCHHLSSISRTGRLKGLCRRTPFLPLVASRALFVIVSGSGGRGRKRFRSQLYNSKTVSD